MKRSQLVLSFFCSLFSIVKIYKIKLRNSGRKISSKIEEKLKSIESRWTHFLFLHPDEITLFAMYNWIETMKLLIVFIWIIHFKFQTKALHTWWQAADDGAFFFAYRRCFPDFSLLLFFAGFRLKFAHNTRDTRDSESKLKTHKLTNFKRISFRFKDWIWSERWRK